MFSLVLIGVRIALFLPSQLIFYEDVVDTGLTDVYKVAVLATFLNMSTHFPYEINK
jgi:hypothetical protein